MKVLIPIPNRDFDPTEVAVSWQVLRAAGHEVTFATPDGEPGAADPLMVTGEGLDLWGFLPVLRKFTLVGRTLRANAAARVAYAEMLEDAAFRQPLAYGQLRASDFDGLLLPGGHAQGVKPYLESHELQAVVADFFEAHKPVAAVCHGVVLAARTHRRGTTTSVLHGYRSTALTWSFEKKAWALGRVLRFWDPHYYRTYREQPGEPAGYWSVQAEVTRALASPSDFQDVPRDAPDYRRKTDGLHRDTLADARPAFVVRDRNYLSARWPGDVHSFAQTFAKMLAESAAQGRKAA